MSTNLKNIPDHILIAKANEFDPENCKQRTDIKVMTDCDAELQERYEAIKEDLELRQYFNTIQYSDS